MSQDPDYYRNVSLKLSEVLDDIGVNEGMIVKSRRMALLNELMKNCTQTMLDGNITIYHFGSKSEGSTTLGLYSDDDNLICYNEKNVIQDWGEWQPGQDNLLMIQDESTSPGYCLLQCLKSDEPLPLLHKPDNINFTVSRGKVLRKNNALKNYHADRPTSGYVINGPAESKKGMPGCADQDIVSAFHCNSWPVEARPWLSRQGKGRWPTEDMKRNCKTTGCFVVPVSSKNSKNEELEWRISTSHAESLLMFSLNITQLRCYILMKMILKTFINPQCDGVLSSFMCKTVLFHCIQNTHSNKWQQPNLLKCLMCCLRKLQNFVRLRNCPHFIIPENNLMAGRISLCNEHKILENLQKIIQSEGHALLEIPIDHLGTRLQAKMNMDETFQYYKTPSEIHTYISTELLLANTFTISGSQKSLLEEIMHDGNERVRKRLSDLMLTLSLTKCYRQMGLYSLEKPAVRLLAPLLSSLLGSVIASHDIYTSHSISPEALDWFSDGLNSDVASSRLKLASALYCVGDMERAKFYLTDTEEKYDPNTVEPVCQCYPYPKHELRPGFVNKCNTGNEEVIKHTTAFCIRFLLCEKHCIPKELQYEMFRTTQEDRLERDKLIDYWMDWAVVDCRPYLYFLKYKIYGALKRVADQQCALAKLVTSIEKEINLGHKETALNLLGQCMEQENRHNDALRYYMTSLNIRARNNIANVLICRLLNKLVNM
ncbi:uncharacterized protein LOC123557605 [Mercenaria mercenaria]|uniref:uncharacterized protein LOC123557605 n=1 Tax=Mercenaria mercenaria TaxID=6596 RepID=UPI00234E44EC|nr:uncharacterized protein LOC123557605 [Mercenaria mercenaria]